MDYAPRLPAIERRIKARQRRALLSEIAAGLGFAACLAAGAIMVTPTGAEFINWLLKVSA